MTRISLVFAGLAAVVLGGFLAFSVLAFHGFFRFGIGTEDPEQHLSGPYVLRNAYPGAAHTYLAYKFGNGSSIGRVSPRVVAAGADEHHVIVKRHPEGNTAVTEYYILDRRRDGPYADRAACVVGPLDHDRFLAERLAMHVSPALDFSVFF